MNCLSGLRLCSAALLCSVSLLSQDFPSEQQRLVATAKLWTTVKFFHPYLATQAIDWDKALVEALPAVLSAKDNVEFKAAEESLTGALHDPLTSVYEGNLAPVVQETADKGRRTWIHHGLPSPLPTASSFYQAFALSSDAQSAVISLPLSSSLSVQIRLSEVPSGSAVPNPLPEADYAATAYPPVELRILSAFRIWGTIRNFFAYKDLMDEDWDAVFADSLPKFMAAKDAAAYHLAVSEMVARLSDSNSKVSSRILDQYFGEASPPVTIRLIEKRPVITAIDKDAPPSAGLHVGDVVSSVDGEKLSDRIKRQAPYLSASTAQAFSAAVARRLLNGAEGSTAKLVILGDDDRPRTVSLLRRHPTSEEKTGEGLEQTVRFPSRHIGYMDLARLTPSQVDAAFEKLQSATSIIFDARGPIAPMTSEVASCLTTRSEVTTAILTGPLLLEPDLPKPGLSTTTSSYFAMETVKGKCSHPFKGKTVMLIDERTIGSAEHLGLALEAVNNTEFLGTPSAGADSAITEFTAPGGLVIRFSGTDIRRANAAPIQRMGLQPALALAPKIVAIRSGKDVVLEKAIEYLRPPSTQAGVKKGMMVPTEGSSGGGAQ